MDTKEAVINANLHRLEPHLEDSENETWVSSWDEWKSDA
jgi:hypothetical protein